MVGLLDGKTGKDQVATITVLRTMFNDMVDKVCRSCRLYAQCDDIHSTGALLGRKSPPSTGPTKVGPLLYRRLQQLRRHETDNRPAGSD
ncbi:MAG: hypothetical protein GC191_03450 [Azospirillum sp.]|nr:hypothetical protein [Azospirillum sp.]